jgi:hypothetical protein
VVVVAARTRLAVLVGPLELVVVALEALDQALSMALTAQMG